MTIYRVLDLRSGPPVEHEISDAISPEHAGSLALNASLVRSGRTSDLMAKVYYQFPGQPQSMVRLYQAAADRK
jgi:hypothetical protein